MNQQEGREKQRRVTRVITANRCGSSRDFPFNYESNSLHDLQCTSSTFLNIILGTGVQFLCLINVSSYFWCNDMGWLILTINVLQLEAQNFLVEQIVGTDIFSANRYNMVLLVYVRRVCLWVVLNASIKNTWAKCHARNTFPHLVSHQSDILGGCWCR